MLAIHEKDLTALRFVKNASKPVSGGFGDLTSGDNEGMVDQSLAICVTVEDFVPQHHKDLLVNFRHVGVRALGYAGRVQLALLCLNSK